VGIYVVENKEIAAIAWTGPNSPAYPRFPIHQGLNGEAVRTSRTMNVGDVSKDPRYLPTLGTTRSEIIVPVLSAASRQVIGTIDVESERFNAFASRDVKFLEECAGVLSPLYD
jgi:putative methionine-R-sulfoxide reductase with GAF domain